MRPSDDTETSVRIGMLCDMYRPHISGVTNHVSLVKTELERRGHEVLVLTFGDRRFADAEPGVIRSFGVPWGDTGYRAALWYDPAAAKAAASLDVAHVHHPFQSGRMALRYCRPAGVPVLLTAHTRYDLYATVYAPFVPPSVSGAWVARSMRSFCSRTQLTVAPSESIQAVLRGWGVDGPIEVVRNGVDVGRFARSLPVPRRDIGLADDDIALVFVGRLGAEKDVATLLRAFSIAQQREPRLALVFVGDGPERDTMKALAVAFGVAHRIELLGARPYEDVPSILGACDAFVTASVSEVDPLTVMEALAAGLPVLATDSPPLRETVTIGVCGLIAPPGAERLADTFTRFATDPPLRERLSAGARPVAETFDVSRTADTLLGHYERLAAQRGR